MTNSLATQYPELAADWHPSKNGGLTPDEVVAGSDKKVWWKCNKGPDHEWETALNNRTKKGTGCPCCSGRKFSVTNSLSALEPEAAAEWHPTKNGDLTPETVVAGSRKRVWWKCLKGSEHEWEAPLSERKKGTGCPFCAGQKVSVTNSLVALFPEVAAEWHPTKNGDLTPETVVAGSEKKVLWKCPKGPDHEWEASLSNRSRGGLGCPFCNCGWTVESIRSFVRSFLWLPPESG